MTSYAVRQLASSGTPVHLTSLNEYDSVNKRIHITGFVKKSGAQSTAELWEMIDTVNPPILNIIPLSTAFDSWALGVNNVFPSHVVGWVQQTSQSQHEPVKWELTGTTLLGFLGGSSGEARDVNDQGEVVGWAANANGFKRAFLWSRGATSGVASNPQMRDLGTLGGNESEAFAINNAGQVVGFAMDATGKKRAFVWTPGGTDGVASNPQMKDIHLSTFSESSALAINENGNVVGNLDGPLHQAFYWSKISGTVQLSNLGFQCEAYGINNSDVIVGNSRASSSGIPKAVTWINLAIFDLNLLITGSSGFVLNNATAINSDGYIACTGYGGSDLFGLLLSPQYVLDEHLLDYKRYEIYRKILTGIRLGEGGIEIIAGKIHFVDPPRPIELLEHTDANIFRILGELASFIKDEGLKKRALQLFSKLDQDKTTNGHFKDKGVEVIHD